MKRLSRAIGKRHDATIVRTARFLRIDELPPAGAVQSGGEIKGRTGMIEHFFQRLTREFQHSGARIERIGNCACALEARAIRIAVEKDVTGKLDLFRDEAGRDKTFCLTHTDKRIDQDGRIDGKNCCN
ncbi:MAG: hypothetical protein QOJ45_1894 [Verrucomicrobiota bacterium]